MRVPAGCPRGSTLTPCPLSFSAQSIGKGEGVQSYAHANRRATWFTRRTPCRIRRAASAPFCLSFCSRRVFSGPGRVFTSARRVFSGPDRVSSGPGRVFFGPVRASFARMEHAERFVEHSERFVEHSERLVERTERFVEQSERLVNGQRHRRSRSIDVLRTCLSRHGRPIDT